MATSAAFPTGADITEIVHSVEHDFELPHEVGASLPDDTSAFAVSRPLAKLLAHLIIDLRLNRILEFGAGASSWVIAKSLQAIGGGELTSLEQNPKWCAELWERILAVPCVEGRLVHHQPKWHFCRAGLVFGYEEILENVAQSKGYDLAFVDAPQGYYGRDGALLAAARLVRPGGLIVLDDAERWKERWTIRRMLRALPNLECIYKDSHFGRAGIAVFAVSNDRHGQVRLSLLNCLESITHATYNWLWRLRHRHEVDISGLAGQ